MPVSQISWLMPARAAQDAAHCTLLRYAHAFIRCPLLRRSIFHDGSLRRFEAALLCFFVVFCGLPMPIFDMRSRGAHDAGHAARWLAISTASPLAAAHDARRHAMPPCRRLRDTFDVRTA